MSGKKEELKELEARRKKYLQYTVAFWIFFAIGLVIFLRRYREIFTAQSLSFFDLYDIFSTGFIIPAIVYTVYFAQVELRIRKLSKK